MMLATMPPPQGEIIQYKPVGQIRELYISRDREVLGVGPAGTGKTLGICWHIHTVALKYPGARILMTRKELESLKPAALATYINGVRPERSDVRTYGGSRFHPSEFRYPNGSVIHATGLDNVEKVRSSEYDIVYVNEATEIPESTWSMLKQRTRNFKVPYQQIIGDCNPSGPRHWLNQRCIRGETRRITTTHKDNPRYWDAAKGEWTTEGQDYVQGVLAGLTGVERKRYFEGVWAAADGLVYPEFNPDIHVREVDTEGWRTVFGVDVGSRNPTAILVAHVRGDGHVHVSNELYRRNMSASDILAAIRQFANMYNPDTIFIDPSAKGYIDDLHREGFYVEPAVNDILVGIQRVHAQFQTALTFDPQCINTIDELGMYAYPENPRVETDKPTKDHDHAMDSLRYLCMGVTDAPIDLMDFYS